MKKTVLCLILAGCLALLSSCFEWLPWGANSGEVTVKETTILDENGIKAVVKGYGSYKSDLLGLDRVLLIDVTNGSERSVSFGLGNASINGVMTDAQYYLGVMPGETVTFPAIFDEAPLEFFGITTIADYEFSVVLEDADTFETILETDPVQIKTSAYEGFDYSFDDSGTVLYDEGGVKIIAKGTDVSEHLGPVVNLCVINSSGRNLDFSVVEGSVNGQEAEMYGGSLVRAGKRLFNRLSIEEGSQPEKIETLTVSFAFYDWDTGEQIVEKTAPATVTFPS